MLGDTLNPDEDDEFDAPDAAGRGYDYIGERYIRDYEEIPFEVYESDMRGIDDIVEECTRPRHCQKRVQGTRKGQRQRKRHRYIRLEWGEWPVSAFAPFSLRSRRQACSRTSAT